MLQSECQLSRRHLIACALSYHERDVGRPVIIKSSNPGSKVNFPSNPNVAITPIAAFGNSPPVTITGSNYTVDSGSISGTPGVDTELICSGTGTIPLKLPTPTGSGRKISIKTIAAHTVVSASSNVVPLAGGAAGTAILAATAGDFYTIQDDPTSGDQVIMSGIVS